LRGRAFEDADRGDGRPMPAVVSERTAARLWPDGDALGRHFSRDLPGEAGFEVVGVVADVKLTSLEPTPPLLVYLPYWWRARATTSIVIKSASDPSALMPAVRAAIRGVDPEIAIGDARPLDHLVEASMAPRRYQMQLFTTFGGVALFIATLGVYAVTAYGISERRREMHIRAALGARTRQLLGRAMREPLVPIAAGLGAGAGVAIATGGIVAGLLFDVTPRDPVILATAIVTVWSIGLLASFVAARQVLRIDPADALRE
jgi:hypothetical protein